ncbi:hypothetical protein B7P43_G15892 [Cryptotermes secundus]|uniref:Aftiphilin clathrin-binding box domain-containing protein n=1 Tax=Cryptotermes secundus TaxID=105785 RepID=A0A2J7R6H4_9NEOP|nr:aftiphilin isoform X2 [Cryptotermes secundus]PNF36431.1 hypothetical protein B7P43_G15892 [Cryptotermes secundus]PNF36433.1 hypothetical protein B7P43_G15892 [Cryptotermes secundus]
MSNIIPPMVPTSPPPMDDAMEDDEDYEFGDFAAAADLPYSGADAPETSLKLPTISSTFWEESVKHSCETQLEVDDGKKAGLRVVDSVTQDSILSVATGLGLCSARQDTDGVGPKVTGACEESSGSDETLIKSTDTEVELQKEFGTTDCALDTGAFWTDSSCQSSRHLPQETSDVDDFGDFESVAMSEDFAVFEGPVADGPIDNWAAATQPVPAAVHDGDDDYDFDEFETAPVSCVGLDDGELARKLKMVINMLFPFNSSISLVEINVPPLAERLATVWCKLQDMESSHALSYQWSGSAANKHLLLALGIDSRNILFGPRWNALVPRFAANLGFSPLEPMRASGSSPTLLEPAKELPLVETTAEEVVVPAAQFDWNSSGLVNPLDLPEASTSSSLVQQILASGKSTLVMSSRQGLSPDTVRVLDELPDLSFLQAKLLMFPVRGTSP